MVKLTKSYSKVLDQCTTRSWIAREVDAQFAVGLLLLVAGSILTMTTSGWLYVASYVIGAIGLCLTGLMLLGFGGPLTIWINHQFKSKEN